MIYKRKKKTSDSQCVERDQEKFEIMSKNVWRWSKTILNLFNYGKFDRFQSNQLTCVTCEEETKSGLAFGLTCLLKFDDGCLLAKLAKRFECDDKNGEYNRLPKTTNRRKGTTDDLSSESGKRMRRRRMRMRSQDEKKDDCANATNECERVRMRIMSDRWSCGVQAIDRPTSQPRPNSNRARRAETRNKATPNDAV